MCGKDKEMHVKMKSGSVVLAQNRAALHFHVYGAFSDVSDRRLLCAFQGVTEKSVLSDVSDRRLRCAYLIFMSRLTYFNLYTYNE